jgi:hypothetical protein
LADSIEVEHDLAVCDGLDGSSNFIAIDETCRIVSDASRKGNEAKARAGIMSLR